MSCITLLSSVKHEGAQRQHADELVVFVEDVDVVDRRVLFGQLAQHFDRLADGEGFRHGDELGGHHAARGAVLVAQKPANLGGVFHAHQA